MIETPPQIPSQAPAIPRKVFQITKENAKLMAALSAASRRKNPLKAVPPGYKLVPVVEPEIIPHVPATDDYPDLVLARTRTQLDLIGRALSSELEQAKPDSRRLRDLTDAQGRLGEQERILAGRPLPGSRKPPAAPKQRSVASDPTPATPQPAVSSVPQSMDNSGSVTLPVQP